MNKALIGAFAVAVALTTPFRAHAADHSVYIAAFTFLPGGTTAGPVGAALPASLPLSIAEGDTMTAVGVDPIIPHTITSDDVDVLGAPLFDSDDVATAAMAPVSGVSSLAPGTYKFHCRVHPFMHGVLVVAAPY